MAEPRRIRLSTLSSDPAAPSEEPPSPQTRPSGGLQADEARPADSGAVRLLLTLFEADERSFPEFSYSQLLDDQISNTTRKGPLSRFEEGQESEEVAAVARKLEGKYGGKPVKKDRLQDLIDIGYGYDDEDSFIDNSEAYDEFVPAAITTKFGGFYVNSGVLQFRQASDTETDPEDFTAEEKKRKLNGRQDKPKKKRRRENEELKSSVDSVSNALSEIGPNNKLKKKKKAVGTLSVTSMLKKFQREKEKERQKMEKSTQKAAALSLCPADAAGGGGLGLTDPLLSLIGSTNDHALIQAASTVDFDIDLDSLLEVSEETLLPKALPLPATETQPADTQLTFSDKAHAQNMETNLQNKEQTQLQSEAASSQLCVPLMEGLPPGLEESIQRLVVAAKTSEGESKLKFFSPEINSILLDIELQCREQSGQLRSKVYTHLSSFLPCSRDTLLKRVKKLLVTHMAEPPDALDPIQKLKEAISRAMTEQIASYHENRQAYEQVKVSKAAEDRKEGSVVPEDHMEEKHGKRGGPKKLFKWSEDIRQCLYHVLRPRMEKFTKERKEGQDTEEYLKTFLDNEVKPLWPKGWMQSRLLMRESRNLLGLFTSLLVKKARSEKKQSGALQGIQPLKEPQGAGDVGGSDLSHFASLGAVRNEDAALKGGEWTKALAAGDPCSSASLESGKPLLSVASPPAHSLLDLLADQALAQEQPLPVPQELLTAAVAKYRHSAQHWSFSVDVKSPPLPPPPPQSSPVSFPVTGTCHVVVPQLLQDGNMAKHTDAVQIISDDVDITIQ